MMWSESLCYSVLIDRNVWKSSCGIMDTETGNTKRLPGLTDSVWCSRGHSL